MLCSWKNLCSAAACFASVALMLSLSSCSSNKIEGIPSNLPKIALHGTTATPAHSLAKEEYPFDSSGKYMSDWAAAGESRAGRSAAATNSDVNNWSGSYGGSATGKKRVVAKTSSSGSKSKSSSKSGSKSKVASTKKSGGGRSYTVKKGDTLSAIASRNSTSVAKIKSANGMSSDFLSIGKTLRIP
jgi:LysM repeat protein